MKTFIITALLGLLAVSPASAQYVPVGKYHINGAGETVTLVSMPDEHDVMQPYLAWGESWDPSRPTYDTVPTGGRWVQTPDLCAGPYNIPVEANAVKFRVKTKVKTRPGVPVSTVSDIQVAIRGAEATTPNEMSHANASAGPNEFWPGEEISLSAITVRLPSDCRIWVFHYPSIISLDGSGSVVSPRGQAFLAVYLAGYWK